MATCRKRGKGYQIRVYVGSLSNGKKVLKSETWIPPANLSEKQLKKALLKEKERFEASVGQDVGKVTRYKFDAYAQLWLESIPDPKTASNYRSLLRDIPDEINACYIDSITTMMLDRYLSQLAHRKVKTVRYEQKSPGCIAAQLKKLGTTQSALIAAGTVTKTAMSNAVAGKHLAPQNAERIAAALGVNVKDIFRACDRPTVSANTVNHAKHMLSSLFNYALRAGCITHNPVEACHPIHMRQQEAPCLNREQAIRLLALLHQEENQPMRMALMIGLLFFMLGVDRCAALICGLYAQPAE